MRSLSIEEIEHVSGAVGPFAFIGVAAAGLIALAAIELLGPSRTA